ncbi:MAG TPA: hypothetical protein VMM79_10440 [Longimicrobiales bacterium]|nr:hypothetical protein [Longimicrobiales bacterium]
MPGSEASADATPGTPPAMDARTRKFRQAAFVYLHVAILYEFVVFVLWRQDLLPSTRGPGALWLVIGAGITAVVFWGLWSWRNVWFARTIWVLHALRLPALIAGAFFPQTGAVIPPGLWAMAIPIVLINLWMIARAAWDL